MPVVLQPSRQALLVEDVRARGFDYALVIIGGVEVDHADAALSGVSFVVEKLRVEFDHGQLRAANEAYWLILHVYVPSLQQRSYLLEEGLFEAHGPAMSAVGVGKEDAGAEEVYEDARDAHQGEEEEDEEDRLANHECEGGLVQLGSGFMASLLFQKGG